MRAEAYPGIAESAPPLTADADRAAFARDGVVCLRGVFAHEWIELAARGIERDLKHPGHYFSNAADDDSSGATSRISGRRSTCLSSATSAFVRRRRPSPGS